MRKSVWMAQLERALSREGMTGAEKRTVMNYYEEMYQDKHDDGLSEEEIIREFGFPEDVAQNVRETEEMRDTSPKAESKNDELEAEGYEIHSAKLYRPAPQPEQQSSAPSYQQQPQPTPQPQAKRSMGVLQTVICILFDIVLFALGIGLCVGGVAVMISSFFVIAFNIGAWLTAFGIGLVLFALGCLIFGSAIKLTKSIASNGGAQ